MQQHCCFQLSWLILHAVRQVELQVIFIACYPNIDYLVKTVVSFLTHDGSAAHSGGVAVGGGLCPKHFIYPHFSRSVCEFYE